MLYRYLVAMIVALLLAACGESERNENPTPASGLTPAATPVPTRQVPSPTLAAVATSPAVSLEEANIVQEDDWANGPAEAAITVIEYGDFQ
jgi:hypothetical protein